MGWWASEDFNMQIVRALRKVQDQQIIIDLPDNFYSQEVEIIVIPCKQSSFINEPDEWKKDFLSVSQWDIEEEEIRIPSWKIEEF
jgi:hypothetical protein